MTIQESELFKLAAKAAGMTDRKWNPLDNDGDALRLLVMLGMDVQFSAEDVEVSARQHAKVVEGDEVVPFAVESWTLKQQTPYAAMRLAIVRVAAEIAGSGIEIEARSKE
jgi:hypothetical protein